MGVRIFQVPPLPAHFVPRPEVIGELKARLLIEETDQPGVLVLSALQGMGGIGKSTIAAALAHNPEVQVQFPDGVFWTTLGHQPDLLSILAAWLQPLLGDFRFMPVSVESASKQLNSLLYNKAALLILDDAWDTVHIKPFLVGGSRCKAVVTTRDATIAKLVGATPFDLDVMTPKQAFTLLTNRLGYELEGEDRDRAMAVASAVGYLPLALELIAAQVADGVPWGSLLQDLRAELTRLESLEIPGSGDVSDEYMFKRSSLLGSFHLSLRRLPEPKRRDFAWLGVLSKDATLTPAMAATLWDIDDHSALTILRYLRDKALLIPRGPQPDGTQTYRIHDLLKALSRRLLISPLEPEQPHDIPGLGLTIPEAHSSLLKRYRNRTQQGLWHTLPDDGYIHDHLTWHLEQAGEEEELHSLLAGETNEGRNGWYEARERLNQTAGYLRDLSRARDLVNRCPSSSSSAVGRQCRYTLMTASLNSLAGNIQPTLLANLVLCGLWQPSQALAYALQVPDTMQRVEAISYLIEHLESPDYDNGLRVALDTALTLKDDRARGEVITRLAPYLTKSLLGEAMAAVQLISAEGWRKETLMGTAPEVNAVMQAPGVERHQARIMPKEQVLEELAAARVVADEEQRDMTLSVLAHRLAELGSVPNALALSHEINDDQWRAEALAWLAPHLTEPLFDEAATLARGISDESYRVIALAALAPRLTTSIRNRVLSELYELSYKIGKEGFWAWWLIDTAICLADRDLPDVAMKVVGAIDDDRGRAIGLKALAPRLTAPLLKKALAAARAIRDDSERDSELRDKAIAQLARRLAELQLARTALRAAWDIRDVGLRATVLTEFVPHLTSPQRDRTLREVLDALGIIGEEPLKQAVIASLAPHLSELLLRELLGAARAIKASSYRSLAIMAIARRLPLSSRDVVLLEVKKTINSIKDKAELVIAMTCITYHLTKPRSRHRVFQRIVKMAGGIKDKTRHDETMELVSTHLAEHGSPAEALTAAREIRDEGQRARKLIELLPRLTPSDQDEARSEALTAARAVCWSRRNRAEVLADVAAHLPPPNQDVAFAETLEATQSIDEEEHKAKALISIGPLLTASALLVAITVARTIEDEVWRYQALEALAPRLAKTPHETLFPVWNSTLELSLVRRREGALRDLRALSPIIATLGGAEALAETCHAIQDVGRWWP